MWNNQNEGKKKHKKKDFYAKTFLCNILSSTYVIKVFENFLRSPSTFKRLFFEGSRSSLSL